MKILKAFMLVVCYVEGWLVDPIVWCLNLASSLCGWNFDIVIDDYFTKQHSSHIFASCFCGLFSNYFSGPIIVRGENWFPCCFWRWPKKIIKNNIFSQEKPFHDALISICIQNLIILQIAFLSSKWLLVCCINWPWEWAFIKHHYHFNYHCFCSVGKQKMLVFEHFYNGLF